jgi:hypothetical protein
LAELVGAAIATKYNGYQYPIEVILHGMRM